MSLVRLINGLISDIGIKSESNIKGRLVKLRQKVEAQEASLKDFKAKIVKLEAQAKKKKLPLVKNAVKNGERELLMLLARSGGTAWIFDMDAQHHAAKLEKNGFVIRGINMLRHGKTHVLVSLTDKGIEYVSKNKSI